MTVSTNADANEAGPELPRLPWRLQGQAYGSLWLVPAARCSIQLDAPLEPIGIAGRVTIATVFVDYQPGGVLTYRELLVGLLARRRGSREMGLSVPFIWVDNETSKRGGREIWGVPKELARFELDSGTGESTFAAHDAVGRVLASATFARSLGPPAFVRPELTVSGLQSVQKTVYFTRSRVRASPRLVRARWCFGPESPLLQLGLADAEPWMSAALCDFVTDLHPARREAFDAP